VDGRGHTLDNGGSWWRPRGQGRNGGLSGYVTEDELRSFFQEFGEITYEKIPGGAWLDISAVQSFLALGVRGVCRVSWGLGAGGLIGVLEVSLGWWMDDGGLGGFIGMVNGRWGSWRFHWNGGWMMGVLEVSLG
jgi:hypothetical protein